MKEVLIHWNKSQENTTSIAFSFIALNLVERTILHIFLIMVHYVKNTIPNRQQILSNAEYFQEKSWKHYKNQFSVSLLQI